VRYPARVPDLLLTLQLAIEVAFAGLAIRTAVSWARLPDRRHGVLTLGLGSLAALMLVIPVIGQGGSRDQLLTDLAAILFLTSGFALLMFRDSFVPLRRASRRWITLGMIAVGTAAIAAQLPADPERLHTVSQTVVLVAIVVAWVCCLAEPIVRFWMASEGRPSVERARLRSLSTGYAGLLAVILVGTLAGSSSGQALTAVIDIFTLAVVPLLYIAFFPPVWLRRWWRQPEEDEFRHALHDLLLYSPDRGTLAQRAIGWAARLVGGEAAFVIDSDGSVLAARGIGVEDAQEIKGISSLASPAHDHRSPWREGPVVVQPLDLQSGAGAMVIICGRLTPMFGDDEMSRLRQYATSISAGLDRVALNTRIRALEKAKSEFLNVASHELRGPMTVIKGYLTMLESGSLGEVSAKAQSVLPLLISKSDEVSWMLEQMVEASRLEEGKLALNRRRHDIVDLADDAIDGVKMLLAGHEVTVEENMRPIEADVDPDRFQIVIRNLLSNAAKYSPSGTEIKVEIKRNGTSATIAVSDHGVGIAPEDQANLFKRFARIPTTQHVQGIGLGLWLSREIARMHDGDLTVDSEVGRGSTFLFKVPVTQ
jgi:signal transduction histidine kinase